MVYFICINIRACVCVSNVGIERSRECGGGGVAGTAEHQYQGHVNVPARNGSGAGYMADVNLIIIARIFNVKDKVYINKVE